MNMTDEQMIDYMSKLQLLSVIANMRSSSSIGIDWSWPEQKYHYFERTILMDDKELNDQGDYPQDTEPNEYRYFSPHWLNAMAEGLTKGAKKHPGETWHDIPAKEHLARAMRHIILWQIGDRKELHLVNASMRLMMAYEVDRREHDEH